MPSNVFSSQLAAAGTPGVEHRRSGASRFWGAVPLRRWGVGGEDGLVCCLHLCRASRAGVQQRGSPPGWDASRAQHPPGMRPPSRRERCGGRSWARGVVKHIRAGRWASTPRQKRLAVAVQPRGRPRWRPPPGRPAAGGPRGGARGPSGLLSPAPQAEVAVPARGRLIGEQLGKEGGGQAVLGRHRRHRLLGKQQGVGGLQRGARAPWPAQTGRGLGGGRQRDEARRSAQAAGLPAGCRERAAPPAAGTVAQGRPGRPRGAPDSQCSWSVRIPSAASVGHHLRQHCAR